MLWTLTYGEDFDRYISEEGKILIPFCLWIAMDMTMVAFAAFLVSYGEVSQEILKTQGCTQRGGGQGGGNCPPPREDYIYDFLECHY